MRRRARQGLRAAALTLGAALLLPGNASAQEPQPAASPSVNPAAAGFDVAIVRPLGLVVLAVGVGAFVPAAVLTAPGGKNSLREALDIFVTGPAQHVFQRPLGEF